MENYTEEVLVKVSEFLVNLSLGHGSKNVALLKQVNVQQEYSPLQPATALQLN